MRRFVVNGSAGQQVAVRLAAGDRCPVCSQPVTAEQLERAQLIVLCGPAADVFTHASCVEKAYDEGRAEEAHKTVALEYGRRNGPKLRCRR